MPENEKTLLNIVNSSGYLLQLKIKGTLEENREQLGWETLAEEHHWVDHQSGSDGYIDLVVAHHQYIVRLVIECKRATGANWVFLIPKESSMPVARARSFWTERVEAQPDLWEWDDFPVHPCSPEAAFCVVRGQSDTQQPMLERITDTLLLSLESLALEEIQIGPKYDPGEARIYIPIIVTTATLNTCIFDTHGIDLRDGKLSDAQFETVPLVRFRKGLGSHWSKHASAKNIQAVNRAKERTVLVIQSEALTSVLGQWGLPPSGRKPPWEIARMRPPTQPKRLGRRSLT